MGQVDLEFGWQAFQKGIAQLWGKNLGSHFGHPWQQSSKMLLQPPCETGSSKAWKLSVVKFYTGLSLSLIARLRELNIAIRGDFEEDSHNLGIKFKPKFVYFLLNLKTKQSFHALACVLCQQVGFGGDEGRGCIEEYVFGACCYTQYYAGSIKEQND